jgi:hypothetical protein
MITNPYRPSVRETAPNDLPFIVKSSDELPAAPSELDCMRYGKPVNLKTHI